MISSRFIKVVTLLGAAAVLGGCTSDAGQPGIGQVVTKPADVPAPVTQAQVKIMGSGPPPGAPGSSSYAGPGSSGAYSAVTAGEDKAHALDAERRAKALASTGGN